MQSQQSTQKERSPRGFTGPEEANTNTEVSLRVYSLAPKTARLSNRVSKSVKDRNTTQPPPGPWNPFFFRFLDCGNTIMLINFNTICTNSIFFEIQLLVECRVSVKITIIHKPNYKIQYSWRLLSSNYSGFIEVKSLLHQYGQQQTVIMKSRRLHIVLSSLLPRLVVLHLFESAIWKTGFHLACDSSVVTDDPAVEHPRELQSKLIESREIEPIYCSK